MDEHTSNTYEQTLEELKEVFQHLINNFGSEQTVNVMNDAARQLDLRLLDHRSRTEIRNAKFEEEYNIPMMLRAQTVLRRAPTANLFEAELENLIIRENFGEAFDLLSVVDAAFVNMPEYSKLIRFGCALVQNDVINELKRNHRQNDISQISTRRLERQLTVRNRRLNQLEETIGRGGAWFLFYLWHSLYTFAISGNFMLRLNNS